MSELEIQSPRTLYSGFPLVGALLLRRQRVPNLGFLLVPEDIVCFCKQEDNNTQNINNDKIPVSAMIERLIIGTIDEVGAYSSKLHSYVIEGGRHRARSNIVAVLRYPSNEDCMTVGVGEKHSCECICAQRVGARAWPEAEGNQTGQCPDRLQHRDKCPFVEPLR